MSHLDTNLAKANLHNLTRLWEAMGCETITYEGDIIASRSQHWPHRFWLKNSAKKLTNSEFTKVLTAIPKDCILPTYTIDKISLNLASLLSDLKYSVAFKQTAMFLELANHIEIKRELSLLKSNQTLSIERLIDDTAVQLWCDVGGKAFNYQIDLEPIQQLITNNKAHLFLAYINDKPTATGLLFETTYNTQKTIGIHQIGVLERYRGLGIARVMMEYLIAYCANKDADYISLQASEEGKPLYESLGFQQQFEIKNFVNNN